ncbi:MAG: 2-oxo acid dehydrogenase subunit E2 [Solirubrobacterales bacterium]|nr:2-oxo acid dehydrogenase subunit E2 [Solirubrobacterales bacterium]
MTQVLVPDIGDFSDVPIIEILVSEGDTVAAEDPLVTLESDKATMDVPSPAAGTVSKIHVQLEDRVGEGALLMDLEGDEDANGRPSAQNSAEPPAPPPPAPAPVDGPVYASPSARRLARELGVDIAALAGSGRLGRITTDDVRGADASVPQAGGGADLGLAPWPSLDFEKFGPVERVPRSRIQKLSAPNLARNWVRIPHVTQHDEVDITDLESWRKTLNAEQKDVKYTMVSFLIAGVIASLKAYPDFNSSLDGDELVRKRYYNIGFAADTPNGLVVPVIKDADKKGLAEIAAELTTLSGKAREGKLGPGDISGSTFTISSLGGIGGSYFTPIINAPEVGILGASRSSWKPVWDGSAFQPRLLLPLSLSYDHRVIDGAAAARFIVHLAGVLSDLKRALL